ncbi:MAG: alpha-glucan family phosphorylase [Acidimicrobiales bacterium]
MIHNQRPDIEQKLFELARNHRWTWHQPTAAVLAALPGASCDRHPVDTVTRLSASQWKALLSNRDLVAAIVTEHRGLTALLGAAPKTQTIAYVSAEFGISELVPQYSGGLGILAGDHLKSASDLNLGLVGLGLFYAEGFFRQELTNNKQGERYDYCDPALTGHVDTGITVSVDVGDEAVTAKVWKLAVGTISLFVLDSNVSGNTPLGRTITDRLYSGDNEHRVRQELILGIGGLRALTALGICPQVVHLNEGHAGFMLLEMMEGELERGATFDEAIEVVKSRSVFTTHTPVPAGIDRFDRSLIKTYIGPWAKANSINMNELYKLASSPDDSGSPKPFNMATFCLALTGAANGVSKLHGVVSRELFANVPGGSEIGSVTNGVHARTWVAPDLAALFDDKLDSDWDMGSPIAWADVDRIDDAMMRKVKKAGRKRLIAMIGDRGLDASNLDPKALTIGFARRFATYKRADLLLQELDRVEAMLADDASPIQFVFAGKAHPADKGGKALLTKIAKFAGSKASNGRFIFVPDYEMAIARAMYAGCDVWLNNPIRPHEASGTSGEKAALNGALQCSILDGWWDEMYDGENGWAIDTSSSQNPKVRDRHESRSINDLLTGEIIPLFYAGGASPSAAWLDRVRHNWATLGPQVPAARMVADYRDQVYVPAAKRSRRASR